MLQRMCKNFASKVQHLIVGHCDIIVAEKIANSFKNQHGMLSKTVLEIKIGSK